MSSRPIQDVSFAGALISIGGHLIEDFMDDANPIDVQDTEVANIEWSCNGRMIRTVKPSAVIISVTVIPGSPSDKALHSLWVNSFSNGGLGNMSTANEPIDCLISNSGAGIGPYRFRNGTCLAGAAAVTANGQGKMGGNTYTFAFERAI